MSVCEVINLAGRRNDVIIPEYMYENKWMNSLQSAMTRVSGRGSRDTAASSALFPDENAIVSRWLVESFNPSRYNEIRVPSVSTLHSTRSHTRTYERPSGSRWVPTGGGRSTFLTFVIYYSHKLPCLPILCDIYCFIRK